jgi:hypothetical protein
MVDWARLEAAQRLREHFNRIGNVLGNASRRESFAGYAMELLGDRSARA